jgi:hypothetical protein
MRDVCEGFVLLLMLTRLVLYFMGLWRLYANITYTIRLFSTLLLGPGHQSLLLAVMLSQWLASCVSEFVRAARWRRS